MNIIAPEASILIIKCTFQNTTMPFQYNFTNWLRNKDNCKTFTLTILGLTATTLLNCAKKLVIFTVCERLIFVSKSMAYVAFHELPNDQVLNNQTDVL